MSNISLKVGAHRITVSYQDTETFYEHCDDEDCMIHGMFNPDGMQSDIWLNRAIKGTKHTAVFIHEVLEAINQIYELSLTHGQISQISEIFTQIWVDNQSALTNHFDL